MCVKNHCSVTQMCPALYDQRTEAHHVSLSFIVSWSLLKFMSIESVLLSNHLILCCPFLLLPSIISIIWVFSDEMALHIRWPKNWSFSFISPSNEYSGLISFRIDWFDLLAVQGNSQESSPTPQFKNINSSVLCVLYGPTLTSMHDYWKNHSFKWVPILALTFTSNMIWDKFLQLSAAAAKLLQSCPTLCDPIDGSPPGSPVPGILQARPLEWVAVSFSSAWKWKVKVKSLSRVWL